MVSGFGDFYSKFSAHKLHVEKFDLQAWMLLVYCTV